MGSRKRRKQSSLLPKGKKQRRRDELMGGIAVGVFSMLVVSIFLASSVARFLVDSDQYASVVAAVLVELANGDRTANNLHSLTLNPVLTAAAQAKANDMATKGYFAHTAPDGTDSWHWFKEAGYDFSSAGENLAVDFSDSFDVERAWMQSPTHRDNILGGQFTEIGIATAQGIYQGRLTTFVVQMFGRPAEAATTHVEIEQITRPEDAREPAFATTESNSNVLGESVPPMADMNAGEKARAPIGAVINKAPVWGYFAAAPKTALRYAYYILGFLILLALVIATELEFKRHHTRKFIAAACLLLFMSGLFVTADRLIFSDPVLVAEGQSPNP